MRSLDGALLDFRQMDLMAAGETPLHRLDARAKVAVTLLFIAVVASHDRYACAELLPYFLFPLVLAWRGHVPVRMIAGKVAILLPFALLVGLANPFFDRDVLFRIGPVPVSGGLLSLCSIGLRAALTLSSALLLVCLTSFPGICRALERMGMPRAFVVQLLFLYRYIFVLAEEASRMVRARELRSFGGRGTGTGSFASLAGHLLLRTWDRAERLHRAMLARGFDGRFPLLHEGRFGRPEFLFTASWAVPFIILRWGGIPHLLASLPTGVFP